jgi:hypothetical protein
MRIGFVFGQPQAENITSGSKVAVILYPHISALICG